MGIVISRIRDAFSVFFLMDLFFVAGGNVEILEIIFSEEGWGHMCCDKHFIGIYGAKSLKAKC